jgi:chemotaxis protein methyltransferase CheR
MREEQFHFVRTLLEKEAGIILALDKQYLVESRLEALRQRENQSSIDTILDLITSQKNLALKARVVEALTTNETSFFRDYKPFEFLMHEIIPKLIAIRKTTPLKLWSAASSTGQEAYSLAIASLEAREKTGSTLPISILGTDINEAVLERARIGVYSDHEINRGLPAPLLVKYFEQTPEGWSVKPVVRELVTFRKKNLHEAWDSTFACDILFLRNVLIYFSVESKKTLFDAIKTRLARDGYLFLGTAETPTGLSDGFKRIEPIAANCYTLV